MGEASGGLMNDCSPRWFSKRPAPVLFARLLVGLIVLICAEVFSGASLGSGLWHPWTVLVTYWLYIFSFAPVMAMNGGGTINLALNLAVAVLCSLVLWRLSRPALASLDGRRIVDFGRLGFGGLCAYLAVLYGVTYVFMRPEGLPSVPVQLLTFVFYALAIAGLWLHRRRAPLPVATTPVEKRELNLVKALYLVLLALSLALSVLGKTPVMYLPVVLNFVIWTFLGFVLTALALTKGAREFIGGAQLNVGRRVVLGK